VIRRFDLKVILLTLIVTIGVIGFWEVALRPPFFAWVDAHYPGDADVQLRWNIKQRFEHFFISFLVDAMVVTMLLRLVHRQQHQREEMQRQLYQSSKLASIGELSAGVAHEINNPLNGIINFAQLLKDEDTPRSEFERQMIDGIIDEGERIAQIVRGLLTFARADTHEIQRVRFAEAIETSIALFGRQFEKDGIVLEINLEPGLPLVRADGSRLRQVVVNMISNAHLALKAKPIDPNERRVFRISARRAGKNGELVRVEFYDNGIGIKSTDVGKVFDPFFTTRRETGGTGLGLSITFGIIRDFGGTIRVESEEGKFTCFIVELAAVYENSPMDRVSTVTR
jgi:signal transduction histidine kinase